MITPKLTDRKADATTALQAAFDESARTGDYVFLEGYFKVTNTLNIIGARVVGTLDNFDGNWSADYGSPVGPTRIDALHGKTAFYLGLNSQTGRPATLRGIGLVHAAITNNAPAAIGVQVAGNGTMIQDVHIDGSGIGMMFNSSTARHKVKHVYIRSPRTGGMLFQQNTTISDCRFEDIYVNGRQRQEYGTVNVPIPSAAAYGIDGLPVSSGFYDRTLIEECNTLLRTGGPINTYIEDLRLELLSVGIEVGRPYLGTNYSKELHIHRLHMQATFGTNCVAWYGGGIGNERTTVRIGSQRYSTAPGGAWAQGGTTIRPKGVEWV